MSETWYVHPNDLIGGWSVMTVDRPPSTLTRGDDGREVATFVDEDDARRIVALNNAAPVDPLVDRLAAYLCDDEPGPCPDCVTAAGRALKFLANANLLLPDDRYARQILRLMDGLTWRGIVVEVSAGTPIEQSAVDAALAALDRTGRPGAAGPEEKPGA